MCFSTYRLRKTLWDKCLKNLVSEDPSTSNMVNWQKNWWNLNHSTLTIFIDPCEGNSVGKSFSQRYPKSYDSLLTDWLPMTNVLFLKEAIYCYIFRCNYVRNEKLFLNFFLHFLILRWILNFYEKRWPS